jgi:hypothetical protein
MTDAARISELMLINLFAVFNEHDAERRSKAIAANYAEDVIWTDPEGTTRGHKAMNERAQKLLDGMPDLCSPPRGRSTSAAISGIWPSTSGCRNSRRPSAATTWRWSATDGSPSYTRW